MANKHNIKVWLFLIMMVGNTISLFSQTDGFNPSNPPEPQVLYKVDVAAEPAEAANVSGIGKYPLGTRVYINASARAYGFEFCYWLKDGVRYDDAMSSGFYYTVDKANSVFTAVYRYSPANPTEPSITLRHRLNLECSPEGACSFNQTSGAKHEEQQWITLRAYPNQSFVFKGWWANGQLISNNEAFNFLMPETDTTLKALYEYNPASPGEPEGGWQGNVDNRDPGDVNGDLTVDVSDCVAVCNVYIGNTDDGVAIARSDVNGDGLVDVSDAVGTVNIYVGNGK